MHKIFSTLLLVIVILFTSTTHADNYSTETFLNDLDYLYEMGGDIYCYWDLKKEMDGVDWDALYEEARTEMQSATTVKEYYAIIRKMTAGVLDGHVNAWLQNDLNSTYLLPFRFKEIEGDKIVIYSIKESAFLKSPTISPGDQVIAINGVPIEEIIKDRQQYTSMSTEGSRRFYTIRSLHNWPAFLDPPLTSTTLTIANGTKTQNVEVPWVVYDYSEDPTHIPYEYQLRDDVEAKILPGNIGYLRLDAMWSQVDNYIPYIRSQIEKMLNTDALIIDVRDNGGGSGYVGDAVISYLIDEPVVRYQASPKLSSQLLYARPHFYAQYEADPLTDFLFALPKDVVIEPVAEHLRYRGKVITLMSPRCFSACDTFVDSIASNGLSIMMGEASGGGTGYPMRMRMPSGLTEARFSTTRGYSNFGRWLEGTGTVPDVYARLSSDDVRNRRDSVLIRAYEMLLGEKNRIIKSTPLNNAVKYSYSSQDEIVVFPLRDEDILPQDIEEERLIDLSSHEFDEL